MPEAWEVQETQSVGDCADCCEECTPEPCDTCPPGTGLADLYPFCLTIVNFPNVFFAAGPGVGTRGILRVTATGPTVAEHSATFNGSAVPGFVGFAIAVGCSSGQAFWLMRFTYPSSDHWIQSSSGSTYFACDPLAISWLGVWVTTVALPTPFFVDYPDMVSYLEAGAC